MKAWFSFNSSFWPKQWFHFVLIEFFQFVFQLFFARMENLQTQIDQQMNSDWRKRREKKTTTLKWKHTVKKKKKSHRRRRLLCFELEHFSRIQMQCNTHFSALLFSSLLFRIFFFALQCYYCWCKKKKQKKKQFNL